MFDSAEEKVRGKWLYVLVAVAAIAVGGWRTSFSIFLRPLMSYFGLEAVTPIATGFTLTSLAAVFSSPFLGTLYDRRGPGIVIYIGAITQLVSALLLYAVKFYPWSISMWLWYASSVVGGLGSPALIIAFNPSLVSLFPTRPDVALAIAQSSSYLSLTLWTPLLKVMMKSFDMFAPFLILPFISLSIIIASGKIYSNLRLERAETQKASRGISGVSRPFIMTLIPIFLIATSSTMLMQFLAPIIVDFCIASGVDAEVASEVYVPLVMSVSGILQSLGAFAWGFAAMQLSVFVALPLLYSLETVTVLLALSLTRYGVYPVITMLWLRFLAYGGEPVIHMLLIPTLFGRENIGKLLGVQTSTVMLASIVGPLIGGLARDFNGTYLTTALLAGIVSLAATIIAITIITLLKREQRQNR
ncbi:MAG: hypothetical protein QXT53_08390 [Ignisphaera sp.]